MITRRVVFGLTLMALALTSVLLITIARDRNALADRYERARRLAMLGYPGMYVPVRGATTMAGDSIVLGDPGVGRRQLIFFLTTSCPYCRASLPAWKRLAEDAGRLGRIDVVGVGFESTRRLSEYAGEHGLSFPMVALDDRRTAALFRAHRVPLTMIVDQAGRVLLTRVGELVLDSSVDSVRHVLTAPTPWRDAVEAVPTPVPSSSGGTP